MSKRLSFSIAVNLLTENFKKGTSAVKDSLRSIQMQVITFAAALGAGGLGLSGLLTRFKDVARETSRVITALKNVSDGSKGFADNLRFLNDIAKKYGLEINALTGNFARFTASATQANMPMEQQKKVFESVSRAITAFGLSASESDGVMLALSQMMSKGKISMEELRKQMGEKLPVAIQAMAKALGVSIGQMEKLIGSGKVMSADVLPKFADALNEIIPNVDTDNLETSLSRLSNMFGDIVNASGFQSKYKALIDGLTSLLQSASKNMQNIVVGIVAAIVFFISSGITKIYQKYADNGKSIIANAEATQARLRAATQARVEAEKKLEDAKLAHAQATGKQQIALAREVASAERDLKNKSLAESKAVDKDKVASAEATAIKSAGFWGTIGAAAKNTFRQIGSALKSMVASFGFAAIIAAITTVIGYFVNWYKHIQKVKNTLSDFKKEAANIGNTQEIKILQTQLAIMNDKTKSQKEINTAQIELRRLLGLEKGDQRDLNKLVAERVQLLKAAAQADFYAQKNVEAEDQITQMAKEGGLTKDQALYLADIGTQKGMTYQKYYQAVYKMVGNNMKKADKAIESIKKITGDNDDSKNYLSIYRYTNGQLKNAVQTSNKLTPSTNNTPSADPDKKAINAAEKRLEALRKLDEEDRKRQIEKQKFDLEMKQKSIDNMDDGIEKRTKQILLNLEKEKVSVYEKQNDLLKDQEDHLKVLYEKKNGSSKGFGEYFKKAKENNFKDKNGISILPEGLRDEDVERQVSQLLNAAQEAHKKGLADINKDLSAMLREQELIFSSDLERKLADLDTYYDAERKKHETNKKWVDLVESNRKKAKQEATVNDKINNIDFNEQLELERAAGMESIGMTELVEEKKLEITKKYLQLRINALDKLALSGDENAQKQVKLLQASLDKLNTQKPAKSLKSIADKAIFDTIKKGFQKAGGSADDAETKTTKLMSSIMSKAGTIANITGELQSIFGGMDESLDMAMETVGNIAQGFATGGIAGGAMAIIGEGMKMFSKVSEAAARHQEALKEIAEARLASQRSYNLLLREQNLLLKEAVSIFGERQITRAKNFISEFRDIQNDIQKEIKGNAPQKSAVSILSGSYRKDLEAYNKGIGGIYGAKIVTGHKKTGMFGWGKGKDTYSSILDVYPDVIDKEGKINKERLQAIINTRKMSDETKAYLQNLLNLEDVAKAAQEELRNYLQSTFGALGDDIMTSIENAIINKGTNAWEEFGKAGSKVIENLGKQLAYELFFAEKFKKLQKDLEGVYGSNKSEEEIARASMDLVGNFYKNIGKDMELAQGFLENWKKEAANKGFNLWDNKTQQSSKGYSVSMDQDTGDKLLGRVTSMQMTGLKIEGMLSNISIISTNIFKQNITLNNEMTKQTTILNNIYQVQRNSFFEVEGSGKYLKDINSKLSNIETYTKALE